MKKSERPTKICIVCGRPFTWRKKWEKCWGEVKNVQSAVDDSESFSFSYRIKKSCGQE